MSDANEEFSLNIQENTNVPFDLYYTNFLKVLSEIHDENVRDRCHQSWTSLYRYYTRSVSNEQALLLEEKRLREILQRLNIEIDSRQSEMDYQVRNILQRGEQILSDIHLMNADHPSTREDDLMTVERSEESIAVFDIQTNRQELLHTIEYLKSNIKDLQIIRRCDSILFERISFSRENDGNRTQSPKRNFISLIFKNLSD